MGNDNVYATYLATGTISIEVEIDMTEYDATDKQLVYEEMVRVITSRIRSSVVKVYNLQMEGITKVGE